MILSLFWFWGFIYELIWLSHVERISVFYYSVICFERIWYSSLRSFDRLKECLELVFIVSSSMEASKIWAACSRSQAKSRIILLSLVDHILFILLVLVLFRLFPIISYLLNLSIIIHLFVCLTFVFVSILFKIGKVGSLFILSYCNKLLVCWVFGMLLNSFVSLH